MIHVSEPCLDGREAEYVNDVLVRKQLTHHRYVSLFENAFAELCGARHALACASGTAALHLALRALNITDGDEVIVPALTFVATANAVTYCGAVPVFVDVDPDYWCIDPINIEAAITRRTKAIIAVHLYGHPCDMDVIHRIADRHGVAVIEDAAEAHGAEYKGRMAGSLARIGCFSFYGNKILTSGEGGMVTVRDTPTATRVALLRGQGMEPNRRYWHTVVGFNYRMTEMQAAVGLAQVERAAHHFEARYIVAEWYRDCLQREVDTGRVTFQAQQAWAKSADWMVVAKLHRKASVSEVENALARDGIETRPVFIPMHRLPPYHDHHLSCPVAEDLATWGICLPTHAAMSHNDVARVCERLRMAI